MDMKTVVKTAAILLLAQTAALPGLAASPHLSGAYFFTVTGLCQPAFVQDVAPDPALLDLKDGGNFIHEIGKVTFKPTVPRGRSGTVTGTFTMTRGKALRVVPADTYLSPPNTRMEKVTFSMTGTYKMTATTLTVNFAGQDPLTYDYVAGRLETNGRAKAAKFITLIPGTPEGQEPDDPDCSMMGELETVK
jgi:hypothetical protein